MDLGLAGTRALITGASQGIGFACARACAKPCADVCMDFSDSERWRAVTDADFPAGQPADSAYAAAFIASLRSANATGTIMTSDDGHCGR